MARGEAVDTSPLALYTLKSSSDSSKSVRLLHANSTEMKGIGAIDVAIRKGEVVKFTVELNLHQAELHGQAIFKMQDPISGKLKQVQSITFEDGTMVRL